MPSLLLSRRDLEFLLYEWLDVELLTKRERFAEHSRETFDAVLDLSEQIAAAAERVGAVTLTLWGTGDPAVALANSSTYLEAVGHVVVAWLWLEQVLAAQGRTGDFYDGKRLAARYFFAHELPRTGPQLDLLASLDRVTLDLAPGWL